MIEVQALTKQYKQHLALKQVSLTIPRGEIYGLIGENGAGKTTLLKLLTGQIHPTSGSIRLFSQEDAKARRRIGSLIEAPGLYGRMSARDNLRYKCLCLGIQDPNYVEDLLQMVGLEKTGNKPARHFSMGMKQRLGIALALAGEPDLVLLDEPINGMDPQGIVEFRKLFQRLNQEKGITIILSSHMLDELARCATSFGILKGGRLIDQFTRQELEARTRDHIIIKADDLSAITTILEDQLQLRQYHLEGENTLVLEEGVDIARDIARRIFEERIFVESFEVHRGSLEDYFLTLTGGHHA